MKAKTSTTVPIPKTQNSSLNGIGTILIMMATIAAIAVLFSIFSKA